jgi:5'-nucleotidase
MNMSVSRRRGARILAFVAAAAFVVFGLWQSSASADPYPPSQSCSLSSSDVDVHGGETLTVTGSGFPASTSVHLTIHSSPLVDLGSVTSDGNGSFVDSVTIPASINGSGHRIVADAANTSCSFDPFGSAGVAGVSTHRTVRNGSGALASTGFATLSASVIAVALLGGGLTLVLLGRRRRSGN